MIARALAALLLLAFAMAPAAACCGHAPTLEIAAAAHHHGGHAPDHAVAPHDGTKAMCGAFAGLETDLNDEIVRPASVALASSPTRDLRADGLTTGPTSPPPKTA